LIRIFDAIEHSAIDTAFLSIRSLCHVRGPGRAYHDTFARTVLVIALINVLFGLGFALVARERVRVDGPFSSPAFPLVALHAGVIVAPICLYFYAVHPAWSWMYWVPPHKVSAAAGLPLMVAHSALVIGSWYIGGMLLRRGMLRVLKYGLGVVAVLVLALVIIWRARLATAADYIGFVAGKGTSMFNVVLGWALVVSLLAMIVSAGYVAVELIRDSRRVKTR
jgi:hypothetical protein